jgi:predicted AAA+ superfamily ATPase
MVNRLLKTSLNSSFFLFGARSTGKSTWLQKYFLSKLKPDKFLYIDLLDDETEQELSKSPQNLIEKIKILKKKPEWIIIDEVQKIPRLLDIIHSLIEKEKIKFILTGSSARKLKISGANMLGGRAFEYRMFPYSYFEIDKKTNLDEILNYGLLPKVFDFHSNSDKQKYLKSYVSTYIKMEVQIEQLVRKIEPFRNFLEIAAQMNGKITNFSKISKDVGVDNKTIQSYYEILEDTYIGFRLPAFHQSLRKAQLLTPKFYFFDVGVKRALDLSVRSAVVEGNSFYGDTFEHFIILEFIKLNHYYEADFKLSYYQTSDGSEIDLILTRGREKKFIEIKSTKTIDLVEVRKLSRYAEAVGATAYYISQDKSSRLIESVRCLHWKKCLAEIFGI